eukprot:COSAG06_NODE_3822_length_4873_cov_1.814202_3_plen_108_part_00
MLSTYKLLAQRRRLGQRLPGCDYQLALPSTRTHGVSALSLAPSCTASKGRAHPDAASLKRWPWLDAVRVVEEEEEEEEEEGVGERESERAREPASKRARESTDTPRQ